MMIHTTHGELPMDSLTIKESITETEDANVTATEYYLGEELVRRDVHAALKAYAINKLEAQEI